MGGSGGGDSYTTTQADADALREKVLGDIREQERIAALVEVLDEALVGFNGRDVDTVQRRLTEVQEALSDLAIDVDRLLFGGSVAKHTYVDGLSDVDALVVINDPAAKPDQLVNSFREALASRLDKREVAEVTAGNLAVTVHYRDGSQLQLLPAVEREGRTSIASENGREWRHIRPHKFAEKLTAVNKAAGNAVIPTVKLAKAVLSNLPEAQRLSGYHVEAIAIDAFRSYDGKRDRASMLTHLVKHAATAVLRPTADITGQSVHIDNHLGPANSAARRTVSASIEVLASRLATGSSDDYRRLLNG